MKKFFIGFVGLYGVFACGPVTNDPLDPNFLHTAMQTYTDVMVHDIFSPPQASRNYAYPSLAAYEVTALCDPELHSLGGRINEFDGITPPSTMSNIDCEVVRNISDEEREIAAFWDCTRTYRFEVF